MDFTREPIIESIIVPADGYKLSVRKAAQTDEGVLLEAVELVSFQNHLFYRSKANKKAFLVPVDQYELVEVRDVKVSLKKPTATPKSSNNENDTTVSFPSKKAAAESTPKKRESTKRKSTRKTSSKKRAQEAEPVEESVDAKATDTVALPVFSPLLRPPSTLISETMSIKKRDEAVLSSAAISETVEATLESVTERPTEEQGPMNEILVEIDEEKENS